MPCASASQGWEETITENLLASAIVGARGKTAFTPNRPRSCVTTGGHTDQWPPRSLPAAAGVGALAILQVLFRLAIVCGSLFLAAIKYSAIALLIVVVATFFM